MTATAPATLVVLQSLQALILNNSGATFAALNAADATRYGVARAVYVGQPKDYKDGYLPQCHLIAANDQIEIAGEHARVHDLITCEVRCVVDYTDWYAAEQAILTIRDLMVPLLITHLRAGAVAGGALVSSAIESSVERGAFGILEVAGVWYRTWSCLVGLQQVYVPAGGFVG